VSTDGQTLTISPLRDATRLKRFDEALATTNKKLGATLKKLAE